MSFAEVQFPTDISYGSTGGPGFSTSVVVVDSGAEERVSRWSVARRQYNAAYGIRTLDQLQSVMDFYIARAGPAVGFRYKDFMDYATTTDRRTPPWGALAPSQTDQVLGTGDAIKKVFQLITKYASGPTAITRNITKPVDNGTIRIEVDGVLKTETTDYTVDFTTGLVTITVAPPVGDIVKGGCEFDVPVRFGIDIDESIPISIDRFDSGSIPDIPIIEIIDTGETINEVFMGGSKDLGTGLATVQLSTNTARVYVMAPAGDKALTLPPTAGLEAGGPYFFIVNEGTLGNDVTINDFDGNLLGTLLGAAASTKERGIIFLHRAPGLATWYMVIGTKG